MSRAIDVSRFIGATFQDGGRGPECFDCWGLVMAVFREQGTILPDFRVPSFQAEVISRVVAEEKPAWEPLPAAVPGALVLLRSHPRFPQAVNHCGVVVEPSRFIHALAKTGVVLTRLDDPYWGRRIEGFYAWRGTP